jgi:hypothetical protein
MKQLGTQMTQATQARDVEQSDREYLAKKKQRGQAVPQVVEDDLPTQPIANISIHDHKFEARN